MKITNTLFILTIGAAPFTLCAQTNQSAIDTVSNYASFDRTRVLPYAAYYQWQFNVAFGGSASYGPVRYDAGGGPGPIIAGINQQLGFVNYLQALLSSKSFISIRNDMFEDVQGQQTGFATTYFSHTLGVNYFFTNWIQFRPEIRYDWNSKVNLNGKQFTRLLPYDATGTAKSNQFLFAMDMIVRF